MRLGPFVGRFHHSTPRPFLSTRISASLEVKTCLPCFFLP
ncbi:hypothetical protein CKAH01_00032 [Colletotrichum kahawae]|uniref:Uncharacterized protein n=1 Tax=Colletotrichum kahawae TaxID=34407 RepID=A0AAE0DCQ1_COLKA|nr:hypothetical protein CKAH01_00032 [Colletotrichum kahawae]